MCKLEVTFFTDLVLMFFRYILCTIYIPINIYIYIYQSEMLGACFHVKLLSAHLTLAPFSNNHFLSEVRKKISAAAIKGEYHIW